jgi:HK97 family phage portal protein
MFEKVKNFFKNAGGFFSTTSTTGWGGLGNRARAWLKWYKISPRLKAVDKIANDVASIDISHVDKEGTTFEESPAIALMNKPNHMPEFTKQTLMWLTEVYIKLLGEAFWIVGKDAQGNPAQILPIPSSWVKAIPRTHAETDYLVTTSDGITTKVPKEDMVYFKKPDVEEPFKRGFGEAAQIGDELQLDEFMTKHQTLLFKNNAVPPVAIGMKGAKKPDRDRFANDWNRKYAGLYNSHTPAVYDGESINIQVLQQTMQELGFNESRKQNRNTNLEHWMIPKELIGMVENSNRSTITQAQRIYEQNALKPDVTLIENTLNNQYLPMFKLGGKLLFADYITEDKEFNLDKAMKGWDNGLYTRNESLEILGDDPVLGPDGNVYKRKFSDVYVQQREAPEALTEEDLNLEPDLNDFEDIVIIDDIADDIIISGTRSFIDHKDDKGKK